MVDTSNMSAKEILLEVADKLPADATLADAIYELEFRQAVQNGIDSLDHGKRVPLEEARKRISQWVLKSSLSDPFARQQQMDEAAAVSLAIERDKQVESGQVQAITHEEMMARIR